MSGGVYISYRREDSAGFARLIYDRLASRLGVDNVFFDIARLQPGDDFVEVLTGQVGACDALVAVIGRSWIASVDAANHRRLDDPHDFVRIEIQAALDRDIRVIPVLVDGAAMPRSHDLPDSLKRLSRRQAIEITHTGFNAAVENLTSVLASIGEARRNREALQADVDLPVTRGP